MSAYLGIDTSNYTTSAAVYDCATGTITQFKRLLPVKNGALGLKQSDAVFGHVKALDEAVASVLSSKTELCGIGVSTRPREVEGSYMPCFLVGKMTAHVLGSALDVPVYETAHQHGHILAALYSAGLLSARTKPFAAFHFSGGTSECLLVRPDETHVFQVELLAHSLDLKAGQAIDRVGGMLGLPFPAGPALEALAQKSDRTFSIRPTFKDWNFCLSGIENQCSKLLQQGETPCDVAHFCLESVFAVVYKLTEMLRMRFGTIPILYAGGVMANRMLRKRLSSDPNCFFAQPEYSSDNAAGIAIYAALMGGEIV